MSLRVLAKPNRDWVAAAAVLVALFVTFRVHSFFIWPAAIQLGNDEGYEAAVVERLIDRRWLPYVDGLSHRGPFLYWTLAIFELLCGRYEWEGTRWLALCSSIITTTFTFLGAWAARWPLAGMVGALFNVLVTCAVLIPAVGVAVHAEPVAVAYLAIAFFCTSWGVNRAGSERSRRASFVLAGVSAAVCALTKQPLALAGGPLFLWCLLNSEAGTNGATLWHRIRGTAAFWFGVGGLTLVGAVLLRYVVAGELSTLLYWSTGFNAKSYLAPYQGRILSTLNAWLWGSAWPMAAVVVCASLLLRPLAFTEELSLRHFWRALRQCSFEVAVAGVALALLLAGALGMRFWDHYFFPVHPFMGLAFGCLLELTLRRSGKVPFVLAALVPCLATLVLWRASDQRLRQLSQERAQGSWQGHRPDPACAEIDRLAGAGGEGIFIWGMVGDLYITCQRPSISMFTYTTVLSGIIPPFWAPNPAYVAPGSREILLRELQEARPPVIIDAPMAVGAGLWDIPELTPFVRDNYCKSSTLRDKRQRPLTFYARKDLDACKR